ncbi:reverse transcriptase domain-containing protein [Tanacetum coccineum]|uniref:Reverse transcriptase domain-containing protein n=1 Tax=Tanacetum coccineum TaxID=301880 RepID=A0ABQ5CQY8_9ASTR
MERFKVESMHVNGAPECMRVSGFMLGITNPDLITRLNDNIPKLVDKMMSMTTTFLRGEVAEANQSIKRAPPMWKHHETPHKPSFDKRPDFKNRQKSKKRHDSASWKSNANRTKTERRTDNVPLRSQRSGQRTGKIGTDSSACLKKATKILPSTPNKAFDINYRPRTSIQGQVLADFIAERPDEDGPPVDVQVEEEIPEPWILFTDGSSCLEGSGAELILTTPKGVEFTYVLRFEFNVSNNEAEYEALVAGVRIAEQMGVKNIEAKVDSRLVANQVNGSYVAKEQSMIQDLEKAKALISGFKKFSIKHVPRSENNKADALSKIAYTSFSHLTKQVLVEVLKEKSIKKREILAVVEEEEDSWMTPLLEYLTNGTLPTEVERANRSLGEGIKARFGKGNKNWMKEVSHMLWAHCTTIKTKVNQAMNEEALHVNLDVLEEEREKAVIREAKMKEKTEKYYNAKVRSTTFKPGDFVYRSNEASHAKEGGKPGPKWEGPYEVVEALGRGAYKIRIKNGDILPRTWNVQDLKKCYL